MRDAILRNHLNTTAAYTAPIRTFGSRCLIPLVDSHHSAHAQSQVQQIWQIWLAENTKRLLCARSENWTSSEASILGADQKERGLWGRECPVGETKYLLNGAIRPSIILTAHQPLRKSNSLKSTPNKSGRNQKSSFRLDCAHTFKFNNSLKSLKMCKRE